MNDFSFLDQPIELAAASPRLDMLSSRLRTLGFRPFRMSDDLDAEGEDPLLVDMDSAPVSAIVALARAADLGLQRRIILLAGARPVPDIHGALVLRGDAELVTLKHKLACERRRAARDREMALRLETAAEMGIILPPRRNRPLPNLLFLGDGSAFFLSMKSALSSLGVPLTAALSALTAKTYLSQTQFGAVIIDLGGDLSDAKELLDAMRADPGLARTPVIAALRNSGIASDHQTAVLDAASDIVDVTKDPAVTAERIVRSVLRFQRSHVGMGEKTLLSTTTDTATGLYSERFFRAHLAKQFAAIARLHAPHTVLAIKTPTSALVPEVARIVMASIRETDCAGRLGHNCIAISLQDSAYNGGVELAGRIVAKLKAADVDTGVTWKVVERRSYHRVDTLLSAAQSGPFLRIEAA